MRSKHGITNHIRVQLTEQEYSKLLAEMRAMHNDCEMDIFETIDNEALWFCSDSDGTDVMQSSMYCSGYLCALGFDADGNRHK